MPQNEQRNFGDQGTLYPGKQYRGVVVDFDTISNTYVVAVNGESVANCEDMVGPAGSFFGLRFQQRIPVGTKVLLNAGRPNWIINTGTIEEGDPNHAHSKTMLGTHIRDFFQKNSGRNVEGSKATQHHFPNDLAEGELNWERVQGPFFRFLTGLIGIGANDRAKIEFLLCRELTRIVSRNYEHFAATGDIKNFDDGRLNQEEHGTCYEHERFGVKEGDPLLEDPLAPPVFDDWVKKTGRYRWSKFTGFIGDIINHWVTDPQEAAGEMLDNQYRSGKHRYHVGHDGTVLIQGTSDIVLERVVRIPVPIRVEHEESPTGAIREKMKELDKSFEAQWDWNVNDPQDTVFKIRDYARYLSQFQSMARFLQLSQDGVKDFAVPSESQTPEPLKVSPDRVATAYYETYSTIRIMRDGSIMTMDSYGNATVTGEYGIIHSSSADYTVYSSRDINFVAGRSVHVSARRNLELVAHRGALIMKARTALRGLCEKGLLWFKSDFNSAAPYSPAEGDPEAETDGEIGVRIQATHSKAIVDSPSIRLQATENVEVAGENITLNSANLIMQLRQKIKIYASTMELNVSRILSESISLIWFKSLFKLAGSSMEVTSIKANSVTSYGVMASLTGNVSQTIAQPILETPPGSAVDPAPEQLQPEQPTSRWDMLDPSEYKPLRFLYEPLTQQRLRLEEKLHPIKEDVAAEFETWTGMSDPLSGGDYTGTRRSWPGDTAKWMTYTPTRPQLGVKTAQVGVDFAPVSTSLSANSIEFKYRP